jgi:hypothetical protein
MKVFTLRLSDEDWAWLEQVKARDGVAVTEQLRRAVALWLADRMAAGPLTNPVVDGFLQAEPPPDPVRTARVKARFAAKQAPSAPHTVGTDPPTPANDPVGRFQTRTPLDTEADEPVEVQDAVEARESPGTRWWRERQKAGGPDGDE